jgi:hypothetical protein
MLRFGRAVVSEKLVRPKHVEVFGGLGHSYAASATPASIGRRIGCSGPPAANFKTGSEPVVVPSRFRKGKSTCACLSRFARATDPRSRLVTIRVCSTVT